MTERKSRCRGFETPFMSNNILRSMLLAFLAPLCGLASSVYTYTGPTFAVVDPSLAGVTRITAEIELAAPLLPDETIDSTSLLSWSASDGLVTLTSESADLLLFWLTTDDAGGIADWGFFEEPHTGSPNAFLMTWGGKHRPLDETARGVYGQVYTAIAAVQSPLGEWVLQGSGVPEPATSGMIVAGAILLLLMARRRMSRA
jgi:hypothetical protein